MSPTPPRNDMAKVNAAKVAAQARRAQLYAALTSGDLSLAGALDLASVDRVVGATRIRLALAAMPKITTEKAEALLVEHGIYRNRTLAGLLSQERQSTALLAAVSRPKRGATTATAPHAGWPFWGAAT